MEYTLILIDNVDTPRCSKHINIVIDLQNSILKELLLSSNEGDLTHGTIENISKTFKFHRES